MSARTKARKRALDVLFQADITGIAPREVLAASIERSDGPVNPYTEQIVAGVEEHQGRIDNVLSTYSQGWTLERMPVVDRNLLRIATWEMLYSEDVPDAVAISEAVELATQLSTDESPGFVNGLLGQIIDVKSLLATDT